MNKYIPNEIKMSVYDIDFASLYAKGYKNILTDLDNTLMTYDAKDPSIELLSLIENLQEKGFKIYIISNNTKKRIEPVFLKLHIDGFLCGAKKPKVKVVEKFMQDNQLKKEECMFIGDQMLTDILFAKRSGVYSILVKTIDLKNQKWYTKINRLREKMILRKIKKINPLAYAQITNLYKEEN